MSLKYLNEFQKIITRKTRRLIASEHANFPTQTNKTSRKPFHKNPTSRHPIKSPHYRIINRLMQTLLSAKYETKFGYFEQKTRRRGSLNPHINREI